MAIQAGDFTASQIVTAVKKMNTMWGDDMLKADYEANVDVFNAIKAEQTAKLDYIEDSEKDRDVKVTWINGEGMQVVDQSGDDCNLAANEMGTDSKTYGITTAKETGFSVNEMSFRTNNYSMEEVVAKGFLQADKALSEYVAQAGTAFIDSSKGVNKVQTNGVGTWNAVTNETDIDAAEWEAPLFAKFYRLAIQNKFPNAFLLGGGSLFDANTLAMKYQGNANGKGDAAMFKMMRKYFDLLNIDAVNGNTLKTYMINRGAIAFASKHYYTGAPVRYKTQDRYSIESKNLKGVRWDVIYTNRCSGDIIMHDFRLKAKFDYFLNPLGRDEERTGVLAFTQV